MENHINKKLEKYQVEFKSNIKDWITKRNISLVDPSNSTDFTSDFLKYIYDCSSMKLKEEDLKKRKRIKNIVPQNDLCIAKRANGEQCTRRRKTDENKEGNEPTQFCGTHIKGTPHGIINIDINNLSIPNTKVQVWVQDIKGIHYYIDDKNNVYHPDHILANNLNPSIIAQWTKNEENVYSIPQFGI
jgi:hypothetical protein